MADPIVAREALERAVDLARSHTGYEPDLRSDLDFNFQRQMPEELAEHGPVPAPKRYMDAAPTTGLLVHCLKWTDRRSRSDSASQASAESDGGQNIVICCVMLIVCWRPAA